MPRGKGEERFTRGGTYVQLHVASYKLEMISYQLFQLSSGVCVGMAIITCSALNLVTRWKFVIQESTHEQESPDILMV